jgi:hypothetical protein
MSIITEKAKKKTLRNLSIAASARKNQGSTLLEDRLLSIRQMPSERIENVKKLEGVVFGVSDEVESEEKVSLDLRISSLEDYFDVPKDQRSEPIEDRLDNVKEALDEKKRSSSIGTRCIWRNQS